LLPFDAKFPHDSFERVVAAKPQRGVAGVFNVRLLQR
jgi:hypothetical protein